MPQAQTTTQSQSSPKPAEHKHPTGATYYWMCKACRAADKARSAPEFRQIAEDDVPKTVFLVPDIPYEASVCREYIVRKYPEAQFITSFINLKTLGGWAPGESIVVVRRDTWPKNHGVDRKREKDEEGRFQWVDVHPETYVHEVVEMEALEVSKLLRTRAADRFTNAKQDTTTLIERLSEHMPLPYRIDMPRHVDDALMRITLA